MEVADALKSSYWLFRALALPYSRLSTASASLGLTSHYTHTLYGLMAVVCKKVTSLLRNNIRVQPPLRLGGLGIGNDGAGARMRSHTLCSTMVLVLVLTVVAGGLFAVPFLLLHVYKLPKFPRAHIHAFLGKVRRGHIAHRGGLPENTLSAFRRAKSEGASAVEVDLSFTQDGHPVLLHDTSVDRTSTGTGRVEEMTLEQLRELDFGCKFGPEFIGERLPTLHEAMDLCEELDLLMFLELKSAPPHFLQTMKQMFQEQPHLYDRVCVVSFWPQLLYKVRCMDPKIMCGLTERSNILLLYPDGKRRNKELWKHVLAGPVDRLMFWCLDNWLWRLLGISLLLPHKGDILNKRIDVEKWYKRDVLLVTWTVNKRKEKEYFDSVLQIPYLTDCCNSDQEVPEQSC